MPNLLAVKATLQLGAEFTMKDVVKVLIDPEGRESWDSSLSESHTLRAFNSNLLTKRYTIKVPIPFVQPREYIEKQIVFTSNDDVYIYITSVDDSIEPLKPNLTRARTIISGTKVVKNGKEIRMELVSQMDTKLPFPPVLITNKVVDAMANFRNDFVNKLRAIKEV
eukprot:TRINITY_DN6432_c0_g1_i1.p1 TRINITY_DN6432_c0_g1~~TRINITY_DN6432_c0_g1_i1.p1  ORF type:complete len:166 (-),score=25.31 TRINITY_DN6432_c0_g1_i1:53-550(-)